MNNPIGVFDSGIGGLTVAKAIKNSMPNESLIYFGDTKHLPYGEKSKDTLVEYSIRIADFLKAQGVKAIVIACNSASALAYEEVKAHVKDIPVYNVIDPTVEFLAQNNECKHVGLIATKATVNSGVYEKKIRDLLPSIKTSSLATPLFVPIIEEGFYNDQIIDLAIDRYLSDKRINSVDSLILGCTHYPLIESQIKAFYKNEVKILNSADIVAQKIKSLLEVENMLNAEINTNPDRFLVSELTESFKKTAEMIFEKPIDLEKTEV
jgi:glutamate racemase